MNGQPPAAQVLASAFGLRARESELIPHGADINDTWRLETTDGPVFVKLVRHDEPDWWRGAAEKAMRFERDVLASGISIPRPISPVAPYLGEIARIDGKLFRAYEWVDGRALTPDDDVSESLGDLLARLHSIRADDALDRWVYGLRPIEEWKSWLEEGRDHVWASALAERMRDIEVALNWIAAALDEAGDYVMSHRDVEPQNILITRDGPMLVDFEGAGPDSASLEAAHSILVFAMFGASEPDEARAGRSTEAYIGAGGSFSLSGRAVLARRVGMRLNRLSYNIFISMGHRVVTPARAHNIAEHARTQIENLPKLIADVTRWSELFG